LGIWKPLGIPLYYLSFVQLKKIVFRGMESHGHSELRNLFCVVYPRVSMSKFICVDDYLSLVGRFPFSRGLVADLSDWSGAPAMGNPSGIFN
jgi:hypothetical protein